MANFRFFLSVFEEDQNVTDDITYLDLWIECTRVPIYSFYRRIQACAIQRIQFKKNLENNRTLQSA